MGYYINGVVKSKWSIHKIDNIGEQICIYSQIMNNIFAKMLSTWNDLVYFWRMENLNCAFELEDISKTPKIHG